MFATLLGGCPDRRSAEGRPLESLVEAAVRAQEAAGLEPITDGGYRDRDGPGRGLARHGEH